MHNYDIGLLKYIYSLNFIMWCKIWLFNVLFKLYHYTVENSHIFQTIKKKSKIEKLTINITLICENDNYCEQKNT